MKIRTGFVSNSSSSSFIVIKPGDRSDLKDTFIGKTFVSGNGGHTEFGWDPEDIYGAFSKINFAFLQSEENPVWRAMLEKVIYEQTGTKAIEWAITSDYNAVGGTQLLTWGYIDHQSNASEGSNTELFDSEDALKDFLFNDESFIHTDNDNH